MALNIELTPKQEAQLIATAKENGLEVNELAKRLLTERIFEIIRTDDERRNGTTAAGSGIDKITARTSTPPRS